MFITVFPRTALEDVEVEGIKVAAGQSVSVSTVGANRDPGRWEQPDELDITRDAFGHLGFSHGIHGCIGQQLARIEISEGINQLIQGCPGLRLIEAEQLEPMPFAHPVAVYEAGSVIVEWD
jgi:cytochrome P450